MLVVVALSLPSFATATTMEGTADFGFASAHLAGNLTVTNAPGDSYVFAPPATGGRTFDWILQADQLVVNWTNLTQYEVGRPNDPSSTYLFAGKDPPTQGEHRFGAATVSSRSREPLSNVFATGLHQTRVRVLSYASAFDADANANRTWYAGAESSPTLTDDKGSPVRIAMPLPNPAVSARASDATIRLDGNLSILVWQASVNVRAANDSTTFESGTKDHPPVAGGPNPGPMVRERSYRLLRLEAKNAHITLQVDHGSAWVAAPQLEVEGTGVAGFQSAQGILHHESHTYALNQEPFRARGAFRVNVSRDSGGEPALHAGLQLGEGSFDVSRPQELTGSTPEVPARDWHPRQWVWILGLAVVALPLVLLRDRGPVVIDDVEWALLEGRIRRGARLARRLVVKKPGDSDAVFLYGAALLILHKHERLIRRVEALAANLPIGGRTGVAFVLAVAAKAVGDKKRMRRWAREAAREPLLRAKLEADDVWPEAGKATRRTPVVTPNQTGYA